MSASGFTKKMDKELLAQLGMDESGDESSEEEDGEDGTEQDEDVELMKEQVDKDMKNLRIYDERAKVTGSRIDGVLDKDSGDQEKKSEGNTQDLKDVMSVKTVEPYRHSSAADGTTDTISTENVDTHRHSSDIEHKSTENTSKTVSEENLNTERVSKETFTNTILPRTNTELDIPSDDHDSNADRSEFNFDLRSVTSASTIPPEVIRARVKRALEKRERTKVRIRNLAKGEASATTRKRRENRDTIKESAGCKGWDD